MNGKLRADECLRTLAGASPESLRMFASGLALGDGPFRVLANAVDLYGDVLEHDVEGELANLAMRRALRLLSYNATIAERLEGVSEPFWQAVAEARRRISEPTDAIAVSASDDGGERRRPFWPCQSLHLSDIDSRSQRIRDGA